MALDGEYREGVVVRGDGIASRDYDFPTANLRFSYPVDIEVGVYAANAQYQGKPYQGIVCYGAGDIPKFELHLFGFSGELLGEVIEVQVLEKVSELVPWQSKERMRQKIIHDIELVYQYFEKKK